MFCNNTLVYGWAPGNLVTAVRVSVVPDCFTANDIRSSNVKASIVEERILSIFFVPLIVEEQLLWFVFVPLIV